MLSALKKIILAVIPRPLVDGALPLYHRLLAWTAIVVNWFPARGLFVIGVTGTKGKSSTAEMINAVLEEAGLRTAVISTIRFKIDKESRPNLFKMTMPGRGFIQSLLREARNKDCTHAIVEITSEGARQSRHMGLSLNALVFTNIAKEHIESHGSYENYKNMKLSIGRALLRSSKRPRIIVANADDELGKRFLALPVERAVPFSLADAEPYATLEDRVSLTVDGATFDVPFPGEFTILNALAASRLARALGIDAKTVAHALGRLDTIPGRVEKIERGQNFLAVVDYAHTPDSLAALYAAFPSRRKICVLGNTGGGRDRWKRPEMGGIADRACDTVILTDEDPYDEDPNRIVDDMAAGMKRKPTVIMDRRKAIREALAQAREGDVVLITGKGTDPFIMGPKGSKMQWSDAGVVAEELEKMGYPMRD